MRKRTLWLLIAISLPVSYSTAVDAVECVYMSGEEQIALEGVRLGMLQGMLDIAASQPTHIRHGWTPCDACFEDKTPEEICELLNSGSIGFSLAINGELVQPDWIAYYYGTPLRDVNTEDSWCVSWVFLFPAGYFDPGIYILAGRWWANTDPQYSHCYCDLEPQDISVVLTLSVVAQ